MKIVSFTEALRQALIDELNSNEDVFILGEDIGVYGGAFGVTRGLLETFGSEKIINTPISEGSFTGIAIGAAMMGSRPVVEMMFMDFATLVMDQMVNNASKIHYVYGRQGKCPIVLRTVGGGGKNYGPTHSQNFDAWFMHTPGLKVVAPSTVQDAYSIMRAAIQDDNPVVFLEHKLLYPTKGELKTGDGEYSMPKANRLLEGEDISIISYSYMSVEAMATAKVLEAHGVSVDLVDLRSINPIDDDTIAESVLNTGRALVVAENTKTGGVAAEICCRISEHCHEFLEAPPKRLTVPDIPISASPPLEKATLPNRRDILNAAKELLEVESFERSENRDAYPGESRSDCQSLPL